MSKNSNHKGKNIFLITLYLASVIYLLFFAPFRQGTNTSVNLIPFKSTFELTVYTFTTGHGIWHWIINVPGNIAAFIPLGIILSTIRFNKYIVLLFIILIPCLLEFFQYIFEKGSCDIDDAILNAVGIFTGILFREKYLRQRAN
ncbi:MAG: VanZ family protein [Crocinitomicaceae bacterium]|nr:VanZ family protein [Crocinitomicaceae bacterium]MBK8927647.1 VanZ family protein [Crocinitomicaceae bacterium]